MRGFLTKLGILTVVKTNYYLELVVKYIPAVSRKWEDVVSSSISLRKVTRRTISR
jgi:hypothetical protein